MTRFVFVLTSGLMLVGCDTEFVSSDVPDAVVESLGTFPATLAHGDTLQLVVRIADEDGRDVFGASTSWTSSDSDVLEVLADAGDPLRATVTAPGTGVVTLTVTITDGTGVANLTELQHTFTVLERWTAVSAGATHTCGINVDSVAYCWGQGGKLGDGSLQGRPTPVPVLGTGTAKLAEISAGRFVTCAREADGLLYCWGNNAHGEIGNGSLNPQLIAGVGGGGSAFGSVSVGNYHTCANHEGSAKCWGEMNFGQLGAESLSGVPCELYTDIEIPSVGVRTCTVGGPDRFVQLYLGRAVSGQAVSSGGLHSCTIFYALDPEDGRVACWGLSTVGQLGIMDPPAFGAPLLSTCTHTGGAWIDISVDCHRLAYGVDGDRAYTSVSAGWDTQASEPPSYTGGGEGFEAHTCAVARADSLAYCWGRNEQGELGTNPANSMTCSWDTDPDPEMGLPSPEGSVKCSRSPAVVTSSPQVAEIGAGARHTCALGATDGLVYCWGDRSFGQLGDGSSSGSRYQPGPITAPPGSSFVALSVGADHSCAIMPPQGALYCWGRGSSGQLGNGSLADQSTPVRVAEAGAP